MLGTIPNPRGKYRKFNHLLVNFSLNKITHQETSTAPIVIQPFVKANVITGDRLCVGEAILVAGENNV